MATVLRTEEESEDQGWKAFLKKARARKRCMRILVTY
jgi:hypothetical protein